jgi:hypothetical protein
MALPTKPTPGWTPPGTVVPPPVVNPDPPVIVGPPACDLDALALDMYKAAKAYLIARGKL